MDLAERSKVSQQMISKIERDKISDSSAIIPLSMALGCRPEWLEFGHPPIDLLPQSAGFPREPSEEDFALIPQYTARGGCGPGALNGHVEVRGGLSFRREWLERLRVQPDQAAVIYAQGQSMEPTIHDGAVVMLDLSQSEPRNGRVFALLVEGELRIKRVFRLIGGGWKLSSDNPDKSRYPDEVVSDLQAVTVIGLAVWQGGGAGVAGGLLGSPGHHIVHSGSGQKSRPARPLGFCRRIDPRQDLFRDRHVDTLGSPLNAAEVQVEQHPDAPLILGLGRQDIQRAWRGDCLALPLEVGLHGLLNLGGQLFPGIRRRETAWKIRHRHAVSVVRVPQVDIHRIQHRYLQGHPACR